MVVCQYQQFALRFGTVAPNTNETATQVGDLYIYQSGTSTTLWIATAATNAGWVPVGASDWTALKALTWTLIDNTASALAIATSGFGNMMVFDTTNLAESISFGKGLLNNLPEATVAYTVDTLLPFYVVRTDHPGGNVTDSFTLPPRGVGGGWKCIGASVRNVSGGGGAGTLQLLDAVAGNAISNAITIGADNTIVDASTIDDARENVGISAVPAWSGAGGAVASTCLSYWIAR